MTGFSASFLKVDDGVTIVVHRLTLDAATIQGAIDEATERAGPDHYGATAVEIHCDGAKVETLGLGSDASRT